MDASQIPTSHSRAPTILASDYFPFAFSPISTSLRIAAQAQTLTAGQPGFHRIPEAAGISMAGMVQGHQDHDNEKG
jgi:hypothetical protein